MDYRASRLTISSSKDYVIFAQGYTNKPRNIVESIEVDLHVYENFTDNKIGKVEQRAKASSFP